MTFGLDRVEATPAQTNFYAATVATSQTAISRLLVSCPSRTQTNPASITFKLCSILNGTANSIGVWFCFKAVAGLSIVLDGSKISPVELGHADLK